MRTSVLLAGILLTLSAAGASLSDVGSPSPELAPPVELEGSRIEIDNISATVRVYGATSPPRTPSRTISVNGKVTPLPLIEGAKPRPDGNFAGSTAVLSAEVTEFVGDGRAINIEETRRGQTMALPQRRYQLSQALLRNVHQLLQRPPELSHEQYMAMQMISSSFSAHAQLDALPGHIDRMAVELDVVHASKMEIASVPLEAMEEHKEVAPGVRFLLRDTRLVENGGRRYIRVAMEYFIDRVRPDSGDAEGDPEVFEATPIIPAIAVRDANGQILQLIQRAQETVTRDSIILSIGDLSVGIGDQTAMPLRVDLVVLHGLERHAVEMVMEDVGLAGE